MRTYPAATEDNAREQAEHILNLNLGALRAQLYDLFVKATDVEGTAARQRAHDVGFQIDDATVLEWIAVRGSKNAELDTLEFVDAMKSLQERLKKSKEKWEWFKSVDSAVSQKRGREEPSSVPAGDSGPGQKRQRVGSEPSSTSAPAAAEASSTSPAVTVPMIDEEEEEIAAALAEAAAGVASSSAPAVTVPVRHRRPTPAGTASSSAPAAPGASSTAGASISWQPRLKGIAHALKERGEGDPVWGFPVSREKTNKWWKEINLGASKPERSRATVFPQHLNQWRRANRELQQRRKQQFQERPASQKKVNEKLHARVRVLQEALAKAQALQRKKEEETRLPIQTYREAAAEAQRQLETLGSLGGESCQQ
jgi:hypothetical protein